MATTYFDSIPQDIIGLVIYHLCEYSVDYICNLQHISYRRYKYINNINTWKTLIALYYPEYSSVVNDHLEYNLNIPRNLKDEYTNLFYKFYYIDDNYEILYPPSTVDEIIARKNLNQHYPRLYQQIKHYDITNVGCCGGENYYKYWHYLYKSIIKIVEGNKDNDIVNFIKTGDLPDDYILHSNNLILDDINNIYIVCAIFLNQKFKISLQTPDEIYYTLQMSFIQNYSLFELITNKINRDHIIMMSNDETIKKTINTILYFKDDSDDRDFIYSLKSIYNIL